MKKKEVTKILEDSISELAETEWASPFVDALKRDRTSQICVEYCKPNDITKRDSYPVTRMD